MEKELASRIYLGSIMKDQSIITRYPVPMDALQEGWRDFYKKLLWRIINGKPLDSTSIYLEHGKEEWWPGASVVSDVETQVVSSAMAGGAAKALLKFYKSGRVAEWINYVAGLLREHDEDVLLKAESELLKIRSDEKESSIKSMQEASREWIEHKQTGQSHPRIYLNEYFLDEKWILDRGGLHIIAARPAMGKTSFVCWLMWKALHNQLPVLFFSLEMPRLQILNKMFSSIEVAQEKGDLPLFIDDTAGQTIEDISVKSQIYKSKDIQLIVIDYVQLIRTMQRFNSREQQVGFVSQSLKILAKNMNCPVVVLSQLNRNLETRSDKRPQLSDLRESGSLEQDADSVVMLYRPGMYKKNQDLGLVELSIAKQRNFSTCDMQCSWFIDKNQWTGWRTKEYEREKKTGTWVDDLS